MPAEKYAEMRERHEMELHGWILRAVAGSASPNAAATEHGINPGTMSRLWRRLRGKKHVPPRPETYGELRDRQEREVLDWMRSALAEHGSLKQTSIRECVNAGTLSRIAARLADA